jgi:hypothetical protein
MDASVREKIVENALWGVRHESQIHYEQSRPIDGIGHKHKLPLRTDCSGFVTDCYNWAKAPDPNGLGYNGLGYTGTLLNHLQHIRRSEAEPGDLVVFGPGTGHHVVVIVGDGADPEIVSHGQERGPMKMRLSEEAAFQSPPLTFLRSRGPHVTFNEADEEEEGEQLTLASDLSEATNAPADEGMEVAPSV